MNKLIIALALIALAGCVDPDDRVAAAARHEAAKRPRVAIDITVACIDGVAYLQYRNMDALTVKIDPDTLKPERCES